MSWGFAALQAGTVSAVAGLYVLDGCSKVAEASFSLTKGQAAPFASAASRTCPGKHWSAQ